MVAHGSGAKKATDHRLSDCGVQAHLGIDCFGNAAIIKKGAPGEIIVVANGRAVRAGLGTQVLRPERQAKSDEGEEDNPMFHAVKGYVREMG